MTTFNLIKDTAIFVKGKLEGDCSGHDWWHILRVWNIAKHINKEEGGNSIVIQLAALLHDISDWKFNQGDEMEGIKIANNCLRQLGCDECLIVRISNIISEISFKGAQTPFESTSIEAEIVQDADKLDAIGAIGVGRVFAYGGHINRTMHDPQIKPDVHKTFTEYKNSKGTTINHFYEKLLLLKDRMNTKTGKKIAEQRHAVMQKFLSEFNIEWSEFHKACDL